MLPEVPDVDIHLLVEKLVGVVDRLTTPGFEPEHLGQLCQRFRTRLSASGEPGFEVAGSHAPVVFVDELHTLAFSVA